MYDLRGCRACLNHNCKLERINDTTRRIYCTVTGLDFPPGDCYPSYFCTECSTQIKKILAFRRRCRRAFFVLKEIVAVRQKVTLADLAIVDRKKTNLTSNVDYWKNNNTAIYSINRNEDTDTDTKPADIREFLKEFEPTNQCDVKPEVSQVKYKPEVINNTCIAVNIKPDNCQDADDDFFQKVEYLSDGGIDIHDDMEGNERADENVDDIDLEDVFKGLPEEKSDEESDYGLPELPEPEPKKPEKKIKERKTRKRPDQENENKVKMTLIDEQINSEYKNSCGMCKYKAFKLSRALMDFTIQLLPFEEQIDVFQARKEAEPYKSAGFKCSMCLSVFPDMPDLLQHVQMHNAKQHRLTQEQRKQFQCTICKDVFGSQTELTSHSACNHWYKYHCNKCKVDKYTLSDVENCHRVTDPVSHHYTMAELYQMSDMTSLVPLGPMKNNCRYCGWRLTTKNLENHERGHVEEPKNLQRRQRYQCDVCGMWCRIKAHLEHHMQTHYRTFECKMCSQVFHGWHAAYHHTKEHKKFKCMHCGQVFQSDLERRKHQATITLNSGLDCNVCGIPAYSLSRLYGHQLATHGYISINDNSLGDPQCRCGLCGIQFVDLTSLNTHKVKRGHVDPDKIGGKCESCKKVFFTVEEFVAHRRGNKQCKRYPVKCVYCDEMLKNYRASERHYEQVHPSLPNEHQNAMVYAICEYCGKALAEYHIKTHLKRHTTPGGEPSLTCRFCHSKMFTSRAYVSHILFNHTPKPYMCAQCPYRAKYRSECREHILKVHAPELLYPCQKCTRRFSHLDLLQQHSVKAHGVSVKDDRSVYLQMKDVLGKIYVFPHMKIDGSFLPPSVIEDAGLFLYDYLCKSHKQVDWRDYYVFDTGVAPTEPDPYAHRKRPPTGKKKADKKKKPRKPVDEAIVKAVQSTFINIEMMSEDKLERVSESDIEYVKVKKSKLEESPSNWDVNYVEHEEMILGYDASELQPAVIRGPSKADPYDHSKRSQKKINKKRDRKKEKRPLDEVMVKSLGNQSVNNIKIKMATLGQSSYVDKVEHEETVQGYDMPDLQADILEEPSSVNKAETVVQETKDESGEEECEEVDMAQLLSENYQVIEEDGEQYVVMNGNLYRLQME